MADLRRSRKCFLYFKKKRSGNDSVRQQVFHHRGHRDSEGFQKRSGDIPVPDETGGWKAPAPLENRSNDFPVAAKKQAVILRGLSPAKVFRRWK